MLTLLSLYFRVRLSSHVKMFFFFSMYEKMKHKCPRKFELPDFYLSAYVLSA